MTKKYLFLVFISILGFTAEAQNLLINGDFESGGNGVGFSINSSFYNAIVPPFSGNSSPGNYAVTNNPQPMDATFIAGGDHTTGTGNMLVVNGTTTGGSQRFWRAGNNGGGVCNLVVGNSYTFSFWVKSVSTQVTGTSTQANFGYQIIGANNITLTTGSNTAPLPNAGWQHIVYTFTATNNCINIEIWDNNTSGPGNDFAVDDFSLTGPPQPLTLTYSSANPTCPGNTNGQIIGYAAGANPPYEFFLTGAATANNGTGIFTGLAAGTYSLMVLEGADGQITINNIVLTEPAGLTVSSPVAICTGQNTTLSVSGGNNNYTWTASPSDPLLQTVSSSANPVVQPTQTTTYTVTSTGTANNNLIFNGDFSAGNSGFLTDYVYYNPNNPNGNQRAYGIVTNAQSWESGFSPCQDHTSGTGNMLVVDGSTANSGNDRVWCQTVAVSPNQNYTFSYWIQTVALPNIANMKVTINGVQIGNTFAPLTTCQWELRTYNPWNSGSNTTALICIYDLHTQSNGNDFAIDDISFTGPAASCNLSKSVTVTVGNATTPTFTPVGPICSGGPVSPLPTTSLNGIVGVWTPPINNLATTTYTFNPAPDQCGTTTTMEIAIAVGTIPIFMQVGPICENATINDLLPSISVNGVTGSWSPPFDNTTTTTYTFTPDAGQCATNTTMTVTVNPNIVPTFNPVGAVCTGTVINPLPTTSLNGITGTWSPAINNTQTTTYTFTPAADQCATTTTMQIVIIPSNVIPTFGFGPTMTICSSPDPALALPTTSDNGIPGSWNPSILNTYLIGTTIYTFTPDPINTCAATFILTVTVTGNDALAIRSGCDGTDFVLHAEGSAQNTSFTWYNEQGEIIGTAASVIVTEKGEYKLSVSGNGCNQSIFYNVDSIYCKIPKGISPNTDNFNDYFELSNLNVSKLQIFNRYGTEVYSKKNYKNEWDGKSDKGDILPDGTYYYVINFETGKSKTGWVYINK